MFVFVFGVGLEKLEAFLGSLMDHPNIRRSNVFCKSTNAKKQQKKSRFSSLLGLFWVKTTSLSGHHSRFGTTCSGEH